MSALVVIGRAIVRQGPVRGNKDDGSGDDGHHSSEPQSGEKRVGRFHSGFLSSLSMLRLHDKDFPLQDIPMELSMDVTPELEHVPAEVLRQVEAKTDRVPRIDAETIGRI